jgi:chromosome segregation ATPase
MENLKTNQDKATKMKIIIKGLSKEKENLEDLITKQENKVSDLATKIRTVEKNIREKNKELKDNEENYLKLVDIIEEQKKLIENLTKANLELPSKGILTTKDEMHLKKQLAEKDNEISSLRLRTDNLKLEVSGIYYLLFFN